MKFISFFLSSKSTFFSAIILLLKLNNLLLILKIFPKFIPFACELSEIIRATDIGDFLSLENFIRFFKLLPVPEIKTAVFIFLDPINGAI
jgi:hypothetical protein